MDSYVDMNGAVRWSEQMHRDRIASILESRVTHQREHVLFRRMFSMFVQLALPDGHPLKAFAKPLSGEAQAEIFAAAMMYVEIDELAVQVRLDSAKLDRALDHEAHQGTLDQLPPAPSEGSDPDAALRTELQVLLAGASEETLALVAARSAWRATQNPA